MTMGTHRLKPLETFWTNQITLFRYNKIIIIRQRHLSTLSIEISFYYIYKMEEEKNEETIIYNFIYLFRPSRQNAVAVANCIC